MKTSRALCAAIALVAVIAPGAARASAVPLFFDASFTTTATPDPGCSGIRFAGAGTAAAVVGDDQVLGQTYADDECWSAVSELGQFAIGSTFTVADASGAPFITGRFYGRTSQIPGGALGAPTTYPSGQFFFTIESGPHAGGRGNGIFRSIWQLGGPEYIEFWGAFDG